MASTATPENTSHQADDGTVQRPEPRTPIIVAALGILGAGAVAYGAHVFSKRREAVARFSAGAKEFRGAFVDELAFLESSNELAIGVDRYLQIAYEEKHMVAIATFEHFVPKARRTAFRNACKNYHSGKPTQEMIDTGMTPKEAMFVEYIANAYPHPTLSVRQLAAKRIRGLLEFAAHE